MRDKDDDGMFGALIDAPRSPPARPIDVLADAEMGTPADFARAVGDDEDVEVVLVLRIAGRRLTRNGLDRLSLPTVLSSVREGDRLRRDPLAGCPSIVALEAGRAHG